MAANSTVAVVYSGHLGVVVPEAGALARRYLVDPLRASVFVAGQHGSSVETRPAGRSLRHLVVVFDAGLPCFLGGSLQEPLGPMHFCCQEKDDRPKHVRDETPEKGRNILHVIFACMK